MPEGRSSSIIETRVLLMFFCALCSVVFCVLFDLTISPMNCLCACYFCMLCVVVVNCFSEIMKFSSIIVFHFIS
jgi:hypothetical protein